MTKILGGGGGFYSMYVADDTALLWNNPTERTTANTVYEKIKESVLGYFPDDITRLQKTANGTLRVTWEIKSDGAHTAYGKVYINGVAAGVEHTNATAVYSGFADNIARIWVVGDLIQLYMRVTAGGTAYGRNLNINGNLTLSYIAVKNQGVGGTINS